MGIFSKFFGGDKLELTDDIENENEVAQNVNAKISSETEDQNDTISPFLMDDDVQK